MRAFDAAIVYAHALGLFSASNTRAATIVCGFVIGNCTIRLCYSVNRVSTLADFENCLKLQELYLRKNNIQDINDLVYLQGLPHLRHLWLEENPCVEKAGPK